ncbi:hypothetical protein FMUND_13611 [Fusarium mundagurra]|uniref:F-box domain-containing protein n=1 Tax=Fusarium mundagurra TaxID=1567541 RepID=A0A8H6D2M4_9HYPO|nr:hypothetical protein FMUND_13611 [Fusarium mundagurra]
MDPFNALPPEVQLKILLSINSPSSLFSITLASPAMLQRYEQEQTQVDQNLPRLEEDESRSPQEYYTCLKREKDTLLRILRKNPAFEEPAILREKARRLIKESTACDLATVAKYVRWMPPGAFILCRQSAREASIPATFEIFGSRTVAEIELGLEFTLGMWKLEGTLDSEEPIDFCFGIC